MSFAVSGDAYDRFMGRYSGPLAPVFADFAGVTQGQRAFDVGIAQLVIHFMEDPVAGVAEMARVTRPGGVVAACSWDFGGGMQLLRVYWEAARALDHDLEGESRSFGTLEDLDVLWRRLGFDDVTGGPLEVESEYRDFDELWGSFLLGVGPAGEYVVSLPQDRQDVLRDEYRRRLGD